jgi:hypothetical protein
MHAWNSRRGFIPFHSRWDILGDGNGDHKMSLVSETAYVSSLSSHYRGSCLLFQTETHWSACLSLGDFLYRHRGQPHLNLRHPMPVRYVRRAYLTSCRTCTPQGRCHHSKTFGVGVGCRSAAGVLPSIVSLFRVIASSMLIWIQSFDRSLRTIFIHRMCYPTTNRLIWAGI